MLCFEKKGRRLMVFLEGELDHRSAAGMRAEIDNQLRDRHISELVIDMGGLSFMDSSGIGLILGRYKIMAQRGGSVFVSRPGKRLDKLLGLSGVYDLVGKIS
jgi:stage II sporulation protein AA (anti-sigma F factor antagonist)